jgi:hypothetical protein
LRARLLRRRLTVARLLLLRLAVARLLLLRLSVATLLLRLSVAALLLGLARISRRVAGGIVSTRGLVHAAYLTRSLAPRSVF